MIKNYLGKRKIKNIIRNSFFPDICIISESYSKEDNLERITCFDNPFFFAFVFDGEGHVGLNIYDEYLDQKFIFHLSPDLKVIDPEELSLINLISIAFCDNSPSGL